MTPDIWAILGVGVTLLVALIGLATFLRSWITEAKNDASKAHKQTGERITEVKTDLGKRIDEEKADIRRLAEANERHLEYHLNEKRNN